MPGRWRRRLALAAGLCALVAGAYVAVRYFHVDNRALRWGRGGEPGPAWNQPRWRAASLWLPGYRFDIEGRVLPGVDANLSGLAFDSDHGRLLAVLNRPAELLVLDRDGQVLRRHRLAGASDVEAIAWLGGDRVALLQEGRRSVIVAELPAAAGAPIETGQARVLPLAMAEAGNNGPEGLAYDRAGDALYVSKERAPVGLYRLQGLAAGGPVRQTDLGAWLRRLPFATDLSSLEFDAVHRHLLLLSDESQLLAEVTLDGTPVSWRGLAGDGWALPMPQPEGVALDERGTLYVVSEPNLFYRLVPGPHPAARRALAHAAKSP